MKGYKDSDGKFHPIQNSKGVRKSRDQSAKTQGVKLDDGIRKRRTLPDKGDNTYWSQNGKYQKEADILQSFVPASGESPYTDIELFRMASNIYYDIFNNGGANLDGSRESEFTVLEGYGFEMPTLNKIIEANEMEDGEPVGDADEFFEDAQTEIDNVMDQVIERIKTMPQNHLGEKENERI